MSMSTDDRFAARFAALAPESGTGDWLDVERRARGLRRKHLLAYAAAATVAVILVGCTTAFGPRVIDFFSAEPSPPHVIDFLSVVETANTYADPSFPGFDPKQTRRVMDSEFAGGHIQLDLTPLRGGGFCLTTRRTSPSVDGDGTECATPTRQAREPLVVQEPDGRVGTGGGRIGKHEGGAMSFVGWVTAPRRLASIELGYEDGSTDEIRPVRVTAPIDADLFLFDVPHSHERFPHRAVQLRAIAADGKAIATLAIDHSDPDEWTFPRYGDHGFPPAADESRARVLHFPGANAKLRVAPAKGGVTCFIFHVGGAGSDACLRDAKTRSMFALGKRSFWGPGNGVGHPVLLWGLVEPEVRRIELAFQDGARDVAVPKEGFLVYEVPERRFPPGKRLLRATLLAANGRVVRRIAFDPAMRDLYPCDNPRDLGFGPPVCP